MNYGRPNASSATGTRNRVLTLRLTQASVLSVLMDVLAHVRSVNPHIVEGK